MLSVRSAMGVAKGNAPSRIDAYAVPSRGVVNESDPYRQLQRIRFNGMKTMSIELKRGQAVTLSDLITRKRDEVRFYHEHRETRLISCSMASQGLQ